MTALSKVPEQGLAVVGDKDAMIAKLHDFEERQQVIIDHIDKHFVRDIDYGPTDDRSPKPTLKKPGAEKVCRMFNTRPVWRRDDETWEMLGKPPGEICYICQIIDNATGQVVGEGRGADRVGNKKRDANKAIKNAEKCALVDAALYTFCLSEKFTQDEIGNGNGDASLSDEKRAFMVDVGEWRRGCESSLTDINFIRAVIEQELHKTRIDTLGELAHVRDVIRDYDRATAQKIPA